MEQFAIPYHALDQYSNITQIRDNSVMKIDF